MKWALIRGMEKMFTKYKELKSRYEIHLLKLPTRVDSHCNLLDKKQGDFVPPRICFLD